MAKSYAFIIGSLVLSLSISTLTYFYTSFYSFVGFDKALEGILLFSSISLGFYGACLSVIASISNTKVVKEIMVDKEEKIEFIVLVCLTLVTGFCTVVLTILYQVFLENGQMKEVFYKYLSAIWAGAVTLFVCMNIVFILVSFLIFFNNKDDEKGKKAKVYNPTLKKLSDKK